MFTTRPEIAATFGAVASTHWIASQVGMAVLERGGNAFDAAVAAGFTLQVAEPHLNGLGGDVPMILHAASTGTQHLICGQGVSPAAATIGRVAELDLARIPGTGLLPAVVPGCFDAWCLMLERWGSWDFAEVIAYATHYARHGIHLVPNITGAISSVKQLFEEAWPSSAAVFLPGGNVPEAGRLFARPALADTYDRLAREAVGATRESRIRAVRKAWSEGFVADAIDDFCRTQEVLDVSGRKHGGLLRGEDMARWSATVEDPLRYDYHGHTVLKAGVWSQGPVFLQQLALLRGFDIGAMDPVGPDFVHTVAECAKLAFADREAFYGDPDFTDIPIATLLSAAYNDDRRALIGPDASMELRPGRIAGHAGRIVRSGAAPAGGAGVGEPTMTLASEVRGDTCHVDVIDRWGNMVSATPSGGWLQSSPIIPSLGFCLGTRGQMFTLEPGLPNSLAPRKRPRTTLSPSFALRDGKPWMAFGTPGGDQQDQWSVIFFLRMVHQGLGIQQALDMPSFHTEHMPSSFWPGAANLGKLVLEGRFDAEVVGALERRGHLVTVGGPWSEGRLSAARIEPDGQIFAGANPRGMQGYAVGR
jgi:gamma-glutamyltranspeptidase/glutathione hydrolase